MKINFSQKLKNLDGSVSDEAPTLGAIAVRALVETLEGDQKATGEDKFKRAVLAQKVHDAGEIDISVEEVSKIKSRIGQAFPPVIVFAAWSLLDG